MLNEQILDELKRQVLRGDTLKESHKHFIAALIEQHKQAVLSNEFYLNGDSVAKATWPTASSDPLTPLATDIPHSER